MTECEKQKTSGSLPDDQPRGAAGAPDRKRDPFEEVVIALPRVEDLISKISKRYPGIAARGEAK